MACPVRPACAQRLQFTRRARLCSRATHALVPRARLDDPAPRSPLSVRSRRPPSLCLASPRAIDDKMTIVYPGPAAVLEQGAALTAVGPLVRLEHLRARLRAEMLGQGGETESAEVETPVAAENASADPVRRALSDRGVSRRTSQCLALGTGAQSAR